ncbi:MAG: DUF1801 domain-containing protein [Polyangiales bacterium]
MSRSNHPTRPPVSASRKGAPPAKKKPAAKKQATTVAKTRPTAKAPEAKPKPGAEVPAKQPRRPAPRADYGGPVDAFYAKQPLALQPLLLALRKLVEQAAPDATSSLKWGMPFYEIDGELVCAIGGHKAHVNLILPGPPGTYADPDDQLIGDGKTGRRLQLRSLDELPIASVRDWLRTAVARVRRH